ncbi:MAG TPA: Ig-like domain-containing protein, partial [Roseimicrobium sp.]|nr:Ig-like domain-containing protein [Roseimicrobium sp.]
MKRWIAVLLLVVFAWVENSGAQGFPNVPQTPGQLLTPLLEPMQGRTAVIEWHNGWLYTAPESPDSLPGSDLQARRWDLSNLANVHAVELLGVSPQPVNAHGSLKVGDRLVLGGNLYDGQPWSFRAVSPGVNQRGPIDGLNGIGVRGSLYYPWFVDQTYWSYNAVEGNASLWLRGEQLSSWDHLGLTGVIGHPFIIGNLLIFASDMSRTGVATYDISDPANPQLLDVLKTGGPGGYWPELWGADGKLYVVFPYRENGHGMRVVDVTDPSNLRFLADVSLPGAEPMYVQFQDEYAFLGSHKVDMRTFQSVLTFDTAGTGVDTSQYLLPLGNLLVTGGAAPNQGLAVWAHQAAPDTRGPSVGYHIPRAGQTNYPVGAPISLLIHETIESQTITVGTNFIVRPLGGTSIPGIVAFAFDDTLTFTPDAPLLSNTTYEVVIPAGGIRDAAGNGIEGYSFTFSTGGNVQGNRAPQITQFTATPYAVGLGAPVTFNATALDPDGDAIQFRFDFGDGSERTAWAGATNALHAYSAYGHFQAKVQVRDASGIITTRAFTVTVVEALPAGPRPASSSQVVLHNPTRTVWTVNPDNNSIRSMNADSLLVGAEISVGADPRSLAVDASGVVWVACHDADRLDLVSGGAVIQSITLPYGSAPFGIVMSPDGVTAYVSLLGRGELARFSTATRTQTGAVAVGPTPRALAINAAGDRVYVTRLISPASWAEVWEVNTATMAMNRTLISHKFGGILHADGTAEGKGVANQIAGAALSPDGTQLFVTANKMNTDRGVLTDNDLDSDNTVRNVVLVFDVASGQRTDALDIDNSDSASAVGFTPLGDYFLVTLQGNNEVALFDRLAVNSEAGLGGLVGRRSVGAAPQGVVVDPVTRRAFVNNFMGRSVTVLELDTFLQSGALNLPSTTHSTVNTELLAADVLRGKQLFYNASDPRMSAEGYISCATCHNDGGHDGRVWDFTGRGEGLRNTATLRGRSGTGHGNVHWSANFDEIQDFEHDIRNAFGGAGFLSNTQFASANTPLGAPKAGLNADLDALAAYVASLTETTTPRSPYRQSDGALTTNALAGAAVFASLQCNACHAGPSMTDTLLHNVGTLRASSGQRLGLPLPGIETPTLRGLWETAPYLHDGSAATLEQVFAVATGTTYPAENAALSGNAGLQTDIGFNVLINFDRTVRDRAFVELQSPATLTFANVDGGSGGIGAVEIRYSSTGVYPVILRVNGVDHPINLQPTGNEPAWRLTCWNTLRVEGVALNAGTANSIAILAQQVGPNIGIDEITVSNADDLEAAYPHRQVLGLSETQRQQLLAYLLQLDGSAVDNGPVPPPSVQVTLPADAQAGGSSTRSTLQFTVEFSRLVSGFMADDLIVTGTAQPQLIQVTVLNPGRSYRVSVSGMLRSGTVSVSVNAGAATDIAGIASTAAVPAVLNWQPFIDDLAPRGDEFGNASSISQWSLLQNAEGWNINKLEQWNVNSSAPGRMRLMPTTTAWYMNLRGPMVFKEVTGDFIATVRIDIGRRNNQPGRPEAAYSFGGLMIRAPQNTVAAAPNPPAAPGTRLSWPPSGFASDWTPNQENHIGISLGSPYTWQNPATNQWVVEVRSTVNGYTSNGWSPEGVPAGTGVVTLQAVRIGSTFLLLRRHGDGPWIIEQRYERADLPATVQVGMHCVTDYQGILDNNLFSGQNGLEDTYHHNRNVISAANGFINTNPDLVMDVDYFRLSRPPETLTESMLQSVAVTRAGNGVQWLADNALAGYVGNAADRAHRVQLSGGASTFEHFATSHGLAANPLADPDGDGSSNLAEWALGGSDPANANDRPLRRQSVRRMEDGHWFVMSYVRVAGGGVPSVQSYLVEDIV